MNSTRPYLFFTPRTRFTVFKLIIRNACCSQIGNKMGIGYLNVKAGGLFEFAVLRDKYIFTAII